MSNAGISLGLFGEDIASRYLRSCGLKILARNYRQKTGEIDIIARDGKCLVFIEVKTRKTLRFGQPYEAVTQKKQMQINTVAQEYITRNSLGEQAMRFDVISITIQKDNEPQINHLKNCFDAVF